MNKIYTFNLPIYIDIPRKTKKDKRVYLNLNVYRNLHHMINNKVKALFAPISNTGKFRAKKISISYFLYKSTKRSFDTMNIISIVDKFFLDWLIANDYIPNDSFDNVEYDGISGKSQAELDFVTAKVRVIE